MHRCEKGKGLVLRGLIAMHTCGGTLRAVYFSIKIFFHSV